MGLIARMGGIVLLVAAAAVWVSLVTWSIEDPSLTHATATPPRNLLGPLGAIVSDLMLQTFGFAAVFALLPPLLWGAELISRQQLRDSRTKVVFYPLAVLAVSAAIACYPAPWSWPLNHGLGGAMGDGLFGLAVKLFATINKDRADIAAALFLNISSLGLVARCTGLDLDGVLKLVSGLRQARAPRLARPSFLFRFKKARTATPEPQAIAAGEELPWPEEVHENAPLPESSGVRGEERWHGYAPVAHALDRLAAIAEKQEAYLSALAQGMRSRAENIIAPPPERPHTAPAPRAPVPNIEALQETPQFAPTHIAPDLRPSSDENRGAGFDFSTDAGSHAIAARFAPASAEPAQQPEKVAAHDTQSAPKLPAMLARSNGPRVRQWKRPSLNLLKKSAVAKPGQEFSQTVMRGNARLLEDVLKDFGIKGEVKEIRPGPVVTLYELEPARGTKSSRVIGLADDIARSMSLSSVRAAVVPGRNAIGLELPNLRREPVLLREMLESEAYKASDATLPIALGKSIAGEPIVADLARMPHLLVAGTTGSGKSVGVNAFVLSLIYRHSPNECRFLMIDPKMLELSVYNGIPHLLTPVVTDPHKAVAALNWAVGEMEERYKRMATLSVRNIDVFNNRVRNALKRGEMLSRTVQTGFDRSGQAVFEKQKMNHEPMPHIVIVVDEFADLMLVAGKEVEAAVQRLAQMARAAGIHLIMATQRPSVDVITGTIKANFPTRISFKVASKIDSRTILNDQGAEQLLGQGDMLYSGGAGMIVRVHGAFVADEEVEAITESLRQQGGPQYLDGIVDAPDTSAIASGERLPGENDLYDRAVAIVLQDKKASTSYLQRRLSIGYNRAADLVERMEREGLISPANAVGKREILGSGRIEAA